MDIRKISIGTDYKNTSMHYIVGQSVLSNSNKIYMIKYDEKKNAYKLFIINHKDEIVLWKEFNFNMPITIEYNIDF
jgi:hypothetical protein